MCSVKKKKKKKERVDEEKQKRQQRQSREGASSYAWLTSSNLVSACRHTVSSEDQPSSHSPRDQNHRHLSLRRDNLTIIVPI